MLSVEHAVVEIQLTHLYMLDGLKVEHLQDTYTFVVSVQVLELVGLNVRVTYVIVAVKHMLRKGINMLSILISIL